MAYAMPACRVSEISHCDAGATRLAGEQFGLRLEGEVEGGAGGEVGQVHPALAAKHAGPLLGVTARPVGPAGSTHV